jgi:hypothetical protein
MLIFYKKERLILLCHSSDNFCDYIMGLIDGPGRKWFGLICIMIELNLLGGNILGFAALFSILPKYNIYSNLCPIVNVKTNHTIATNHVTCDLQTRQYQVFSLD